MANDLTLCQQIHCSWNHECLRFLQVPNQDRQWYALFGIEGCKQFMKVVPGDDVRSKEEAIKSIRAGVGKGY